MARNDAGRTLTPDEVREYSAYQNAAMTPPAKYDGVVFENTAASGAVYRFQTDDERKAAETAASDAEARARADADLAARIQAEAGKRAVTEPPAVPAAPAAPKDR